MSPSGAPLRMSCQAAGPLGTTATDPVLSRIAGTEPAVIDQASFGACLSLGRTSGVLQPARRDDRAIDLSVTGRLIAPVEVAGLQEHAVVAAPRGPQAGLGDLFKGGPHARPTQIEQALVETTSAD